MLSMNLYQDEFSCPSGFTGEQCEYNICQSIKCQNKEQCFVENNQPICR